MLPTDELAEIICQDLKEDAPSESPPVEVTELSQTESGLNTLQQPACKFEEVKLVVDRRLLLNRARKLKMYRIWLQVRICFCHVSFA
jgi:hypothetical protein